MPETNPANRAAIALTLAFLIALATTLSALFIGEVLGKMPCTLCWYQRIAMFPLVVILGVAAVRDDTMARWTAAPPAFAGLLLAAWRSALFAGSRTISASHRSLHQGRSVLHRCRGTDRAGPALALPLAGSFCRNSCLSVCLSVCLN